MPILRPPSSEGELICIMLTIESTIMDMAMGVDATDWRNVLFLFGFSLDGGRRIGIVRRLFDAIFKLNR